MSGNENDRNGPPERTVDQVEYNDPSNDPLADQFAKGGTNAQDIAESIASTPSDTMLETAQAAIASISKPPSKNAKKHRG